MDEYKLTPKWKWTTEELLWYPINARAEQVPADLKMWRKYRGLSLRDVSERTGISNPYLSQLENGKTKNPSFDVIVKLCQCYMVVLVIK